MKIFDHLGAKRGRGRAAWPKEHCERRAKKNRAALTRAIGAPVLLDCVERDRILWSISGIFGIFGAEDLRATGTQRSTPTSRQLGGEICAQIVRNFFIYPPFPLGPKKKDKAAVRKPRSPL